MDKGVKRPLHPDVRDRGQVKGEAMPKEHVEDIGRVVNRRIESEALGIAYGLE